MKILRLLLVLGLVAVFCGGIETAKAQPGVAADHNGVFHGSGDHPQLAILDTDIGDDIDDAFALALALKSPELKLLGVTTAFGDTELRTRLVDRYLAAVGRSDITVAAGIATKANNVFTQAAYAKQHQSQCLQSLLTATPATNNVCSVGGPAHEEGVEFLLDQIRAHPGEITLIAIGPQNNIEEAIKRNPETFRKLKRVVMMGGSIYRGYGDASAPPSSEWNVNRDPAGLRALLNSGVPVFMMPLDSTQIQLQAPEREKIFSHGSPLTDQLTLLYHQWMAGSEGHPAAPTLFDPVAVAYAIRPDLCPATPMRIEVDDKGFTRPVDGTPNAHVCLKSNERGFLELLLGRIAGQDSR
jgi:inosine-uridine nucleoside N-ribohydrolase